ncbi:MAG: sensor histidine kinase [Bacteroidia bacterium]|nr:sensor histidine kinase [Bacteroidia bacterium]
MCIAIVRYLKILAIFCLLVTSLISQAGDFIEDSIENNPLIDSLFKKSQQQIYTNPDTARYYANVAMKIAEIEGSEYWKTVLLNALGVSYLVQADYVKASDYLFKSLQSAFKIGNKERIGRTYNNIGILNREIGNHRDALMYYLRALDMYESTGDLGNTANVLNNISVLYSELKNYEKALEYNYKSYELFKALNDSVGIHSTMSGRGRLYLESNVVDSAEYFIKESIKIAIRNNYRYGLSNSMRYLAGLSYSSGNYDSAITTYLESFKIAQEINAVNNEVSALFGMVDSYLKLGNFQKALENAQMAIVLSQSMENQKILGLAHQTISKVYDSLGKYQLAHAHFVESIEIKERLADQYSLHQIYNLEIERLNESMQNAQLEVQRQDLRISRRNSIILVISLIFVLSIITLVMILGRIRHVQRSRLNATMLRHAKERSKSALEAEIAERRRLGMELHDGIGPLLSLAKLNVSALIEKPAMDSSRKKAILGNTMGTIDEILRELKSISHNMAPIVLMEKGLKSAIKGLSDKLNESGQYAVSLDITGLDDRMDEYLEHAIYRSILEVINNIVMHAHASEISIQIVQNEDDITIMIEDNGVGFVPEDLQNSHTGLGLKSTSLRIQGLNGKLFFDSVIGRGTIVTMVIPLSNM